MSTDSVPDLEDLARRYDSQVLREYLLEQEIAPAIRAARDAAAVPEDVAEMQQSLWDEIYDLRPRCFRRLRVLLTLNFLTFWTTVSYCGYVYYLRVAEFGIQTLPPLEVGLLSVFVLGTQGTLEFAAATCLTQPARANDARSTGFRPWDGIAWLTGVGQRAAVLLDAQCLPLLQHGSSLLFVLSLGTFLFAIGVFVFVVQLRLVFGLYCVGDQFSYDKPDLFFRGRDTHGMLEGRPIAARPPQPREDEDILESVRVDRAPPVNTIKIANCAHFSDLPLLHAVLTRLYIPMNCRETQEFIVSATSFSRCFCEDIVQCCVKFFFLMDCHLNPLVLTSLFISAGQAVASCYYSSTPSMDLGNLDESIHE